MLAAPPRGYDLTNLERKTMKRIAIAVILILALLLVPSPVSAASGVQIVGKTGDGIWIGDTWEVDIFPGESKATTIWLYNSAKESSQVELTIMPDSLDNGNLLFELDKASFTIPGKSHADVTLSVTASGSATPGTYTAEFEMRAEIIAPPPVTTSEARGVGTSRATLNGILTSLGTASSVAVSFGWDTESHAEDAAGYAYWTTPSAVKTGTGAFRVRITDLTRSTKYYFRAKAEVDGTTSYGAELSFTTKPRGRWWWLEWLFPGLAE